MVPAQFAPVFRISPSRYSLITPLPPDRRERSGQAMAAPVAQTAKQRVGCAKIRIRSAIFRSRLSHELETTQWRRDKRALTHRNGLCASGPSMLSSGTHSLALPWTLW